MSTTAATATCAHVLLASTVIAKTSATHPNTTTLVLIHGLDSTRFTWNAFIERQQEKYNIVALDLRGHGESSLGNAHDFTASTLAADVRHTLLHLNVPFPVALVGHSMGGRIAMQYAADYPRDLAALIVEDMDVKPRTVPSLSTADSELRRNFTRSFVTFEATKEALLQWYNSTRIDGWKEDGRIFQRSDHTWHSGINPWAQHLAIKHVLGSEGVGVSEWVKCAEQQQEINFPVFCFVAEKHSSVDPTNLIEMVAAVPRTAVVEFVGASHSIHNTCPDNAFDVKMSEIMQRLKG